MWELGDKSNYQNVYLADNNYNDIPAVLYG